MLKLFCLFWAHSCMSTLLFFIRRTLFLSCYSALCQLFHVIVFAFWQQNHTTAHSTTHSTPPSPRVCPEADLSWNSVSWQKSWGYSSWQDQFSCALNTSCFLPAWLKSLCRVPKKKNYQFASIPGVGSNTLGSKVRAVLLSLVILYLYLGLWHIFSDQGLSLE